MSIKEWLLSNNGCNFVNWIHITDSKSWPENVALTFTNIQRKRDTKFGEQNAAK
jgi:hypothetical protein